MKFSVAKQSPQDLSCDCLIVPLYEGESPSGQAAEVDKAADGAIQARLDGGDFNAKAGKLQMLFDAKGCQSKRILLAGLGKRDELDAESFKSTIIAAASQAAEVSVKHLGLAMGDIAIGSLSEARLIRLAAFALQYATYRYDHTLSKTEHLSKPAEQHTLLGDFQLAEDDVNVALDEAGAMAAGSAFARFLGELPPNVCTPAFMAEQAQDVANRYDSVSVDILEDKQMEELGMGALLGVGQGSANRPRLIVLKHQGGAEDEQPYGFVGKGITFDTGGISLKPGPDMNEMKFDMGGAAGVLGTFLAIAELNLPINVVTVVAAVENMPDGNSYRPGDVLTTMSGQTVEILNTDAEGRLVMCDALTYIQKYYNPTTLIDVATLTGACVIALGHHASGLMSRHDDLAHELLAAGVESSDRAWRLPLWREYEKDLESVYADFANVGGKPGGSITAGCYLGRFTQGQRWAHLDIAGTAWNSGRTGRATGRPVPLLTQFLIDRSR